MANQKYSVVALLKIDKMNKAGLCPIVVRATVDRKSAFYFTSHRLAPDDWDEKNRQVKSKVALSQLINASIDKLINDAKEFLLEAHLTKQMVSPKQVILSFGSDGGRDDLLAYWRKMITDLGGIQHKKTIGRLQVDYNKICLFRSQLTFGQVTPDFLRQYDQFMAVTLKNGQNTRWGAFKSLKKIFNLARKDKRTTLYPFADYSGPNYIQRLRTSLDKEELDKIEQLITSGMLIRSLWVSANYFLLACYAGFRYQDLQAFNPAKHLGKERLVIATLKTGEIVSIKRHTKLNMVLARLSSRPKLVANQKINEHLKVIADLAGIEKRLTVHTGRHTFAVTCADLGIPSDVVMKLLGHSNIKTTYIYYQITNPQIDAQMAKWENL